MKPNQLEMNNLVSRLLLPRNGTFVAKCLTVAALFAASVVITQAASADWTGSGANVNWATTANWTPAAAPGSAATNSDVAGFKATFTGARQPTYPNSAYYVGAFWLSGVTKDVTVTSGGTSARGLLYGVDGASVGQSAGTYYGVIIDDYLARKLTLSTPSVELRTNHQTFYIGSGNTLNCNPSASPQYTALNGKTLTLAGSGATQIRYLNNSASQTGGSIVLAGGRLDLIGTSLGGVSGGIDVQSGLIVFWSSTCMGAAGTSTPLTLRNGSTIDSGSATAIVSAKPLTISGDITYAGYVNLDYGVNSVTLTAANPSLTCNGSVWTIGGAVTNTSYVGGNALDLTKAGVGTLTLSAPITLRATQIATVFGGTNNLNGAISDGGSSYGITLSGAGTLNLNGNNTFTGPVDINGEGGTLNLNGSNTYVGATVNSGRLVTTAASTGAGAYSVAGLATLAVKTAVSGATLNVSSLTAASGSTLELNFNTFGNPTNPVIYASGAITPATSVTMNLIGSKAQLGMFPLIRYGTLAGDGLGGFTLGTVAPGALGGLVTSNNTIYLSITNLSAQVWDGTVSGNWEIGGDGNWKTNVAYTEVGGFPVLFDDTATGANTNISLVGTLSPSAITVNSTGKTYSFGGSGTLAGTGTLTKQGSSTLTVTTANTLSGQVTVSGGVLQLGDGTANNGSLAGNITDNATLLFSNPGAQIYSGTVDGSGALTKAGSGSLTLSGNNAYTGGTVLWGGGALVMGASSALGSGAISNYSSTYGQTLWLADNYTLANNFYLGNGTLTLSIVNGGTFNGSFAGGGTIHFGQTGLAGGKGITLNGDWSGFTGTLQYQNGPSTSSAYLYLQNSASDFSRASIYTLGQTANMTFMLWSGANNTTVRFGALNSGTGGGLFGIQNGVTGTVFEIGALNTDSAYGGVIGGGGGYGAFNLTKVGSGSLQLWSGGSAYNGVTTVRNGSLLAFANAPSGANGAFGNAASAIQVGDAGTAAANNLALLTGAAVTISRSITVNDYNPNGTVTLGGAQTNGTSTFSGAVALNHSVILQSLNTDVGSVHFTGVISGTNTAAVTIAGGGAVQLLGANTYGGPTVVSNGTLVLSTRHVGGGDLTVHDGKTLGIWNWQNLAGAVLSNLVFGASGPTTNEFWEVRSTAIPMVNATTLALNGTVTVNIRSAAFAAGSYPLMTWTNLTGTGNFVLGALPLCVEAGLSTVGNALYLNITNIVPILWTGAADTYSWDTTTANWTNNAGGNNYADGYPVRFDDTSAYTSVNVVTNVTPSSVVVSTTNSYTISGYPIAGTASVTKTGSGSLALFGANTYTGVTTVTGGILTVSGSLAAGSGVSVSHSCAVNCTGTINGSVNVQSNGVLSGYGTINGPVTNQPGGILAPQNMGSGYLTINNRLVLSSGSFLQVQINKDFSSSDLISGVTNAFYDGTLVVSNLSVSTTLTNGDAFTLFSPAPATFSGKFASIVGSPGPGLAWSYDPTNGVLSVVTESVPPNATNILASVIGGQLVLNWPDGQGWKLQAQTNTLATGLGTNWVEVIGATNPFTNTINPASGSVFYRLIYP